MGYHFFIFSLSLKEMSRSRGQYNLYLRNTYKRIPKSTVSSRRKKQEALRSFVRMLVQLSAYILSIVPCISIMHLDSYIQHKCKHLMFIELFIIIINSPTFIITFIVVSYLININVNDNFISAYCVRAENFCRYCYIKYRCSCFRVRYMYH